MPPKVPTVAKVSKLPEYEKKTQDLRYICTTISKLELPEGDDYTNMVRELSKATELMEGAKDTPLPLVKEGALDGTLGRSRLKNLTNGAKWVKQMSALTRDLNAAQKDTEVYTEGKKGESVKKKRDDAWKKLITKYQERKLDPIAKQNAAVTLDQFWDDRDVWGD